MKKIVTLITGFAIIMSLRCASFTVNQPDDAKTDSEVALSQNVDLSGMDDLSAEDMIAADRYLTRSGSFSVMPEMTLEYACFIAARAAKQPIEFFRGLPPKDALKVKNRVTSFFYSED
mgnify:CR=1 FL=1